MYVYVYVFCCLFRYAKHLNDDDITKLARMSEGHSGRDIRNVCQQAERNWAGKIIVEGDKLKKEFNVSAPPLDEYLDALEFRKYSTI